jgi:hypothetical protein
VNWLILQVVNKTREFTGNEIAMILTGHGNFVINERECFLNCVTQRRYARNVLIINALRS